MSSYIGPADVAKLIPGRGGRPLHPATAIRWMIDGVNTPRGRLKLHAERVGGRWLTTAEWVREFIDAQTAAYSPTSDSPIRSPAERNRSADAAGKELEALGGVTPQPLSYR